MPFKLIMGVSPAADASETGLSVRLNAFEAGFHSVMADPGALRLRCWAGSLSVSDESWPGRLSVP